MRGFDEDAWYQIETNGEYAIIIEECSGLYDEFKAIVNVRVVEAKNISRIEDVASIAAGVSGLSVLLKKKKWRIGK